MKRIILILSLLVAGFGVSAQQDTASSQSLLDKLAKLEKRTDKFNFFLNMNSSFDSKFVDGKYQQSNFNVRQLRIEAKGNLNDWLSYRWRQRLNRPNNSSGNIDNMPTSIDIAGIGVKLSDKLSMFAGKQCAAYGGIEFDLNPIEIYEYSDMIENMSNFMTGVNFAYDFTPEHQLQLQILNSQNNKFKETYNVPADIEESKQPLVYTLNWNGSFFDGAYKTRWSASLMSQAKEKDLYYYAFGNDITVNNNCNLFLDVMYSAEGIDRTGIISNIISDDNNPLGLGRNAYDSKYLSFVGKINYRVQPKWNVFVKGMYESASLSKTNGVFLDGKYVTSIGYLTGLEYYPMEKNLHFFLTYVGRSYKYEDAAKSMGFKDYTTDRISVGFIYQLPMF